MTEEANSSAEEIAGYALRRSDESSNLDEYVRDESKASDEAGWVTFDLSHALLWKTATRAKWYGKAMRMDGYEVAEVTWSMLHGTEDAADAAE